MALNAASHNPMGEPTGNVSGPPPKLDDSAKADLLNSSKEQQTADASTKGGDASVPPEVKEAAKGDKTEAQVEGGQSLNPS
ncbi:hypothetical protein BLS_000470 [Venturia inaequalis]|uniref:Uncharacterized protein n=1 Tax=Venturia inaequalis TaxID=5025 RepID=A0A8H3ZB73_VENIN|nr:hypothetical protein BLS_000470 [Venturia inaequalis]KAE9966536.1 hypothetical protein EG328_008864 [Venturia inaequalis]KAE9989873.1 hypothetical protein EG327_002143 [Venturia inaequalis]RDI78482.1 hypothetical protein Vi05172_g11547 [Venturia inaequalis]